MKEIKFKKKRKLQKTAATNTNITFSQIFKACPNILFEESASQKSDHLLNCIFHNRLTKR